MDVFFERIASYDDAGLNARIAALVGACAPGLAHGRHVLVKPNLVAPYQAGLSCTHPKVVAAVCRALLDQGALVTVGDSPAFGPAQAAARASGLRQALSALPVRLITLGRPRQVTLSDGCCMGISADALEADAIVNVPKLKCHGQMLLSLAVKNLFGVVVGFRKALAHQRLGEPGHRFAAMLVEIARLLPPGASLMDGVTAMHVTGPTGGQPYALGLLGASQSPFALDAALYAALKLAPGDVPLWAEALRQGVPEAQAAGLAYPGLPPAAFAFGGFELPGELVPVRFSPLRFVKGRAKSLCLGLFGQRRPS